MIEFEPEPKQVLLLWNLAFHGGELWLKQIPSGMNTPAARKSLVRSGLIAEGKRVPEGQKGNRKITFLLLEDKGWQWLGDNMDAPLWKSQSATDVLRAALVQISRHMKAKRIVLGEMLAQSIDEADRSCGREADTVADETLSRKQSNESTGSVTERVAEAYQRLAEHRSGARVRITDLRRELNDLSKSALDDALDEMSRAGRVVLNRLDNPKEITSDDEQAAFTNSIGEPRHIMHMEIHAHV